MATIIKPGSCLFEIDLQAEGFSMDDNNFEIEIAGAKESVKATKTTPSTDGDLIIFKEDNAWYGILKTDRLTPGTFKLIATAYIPDSHVPQTQQRIELARTEFGKIVLP